MSQENNKKNTGIIDITAVEKVKTIILKREERKRIRRSSSQKKKKITTIVLNRKDRKSKIG